MSYSPLRNTHDKSVPATQASDDILQVGDSLGSFSGYLRRSKATSAGLIAQFFGENGQDADVISALHLTRFLDAHVKVTVWMIKDRIGRSMKTANGHQKLTEFIGIIRRPQPNNMGQVAQFFGPNGPNADAINILNQSEYLDALVYVEMHQAIAGMTAQDVLTNTPTAELEENSTRMTSTEQVEFKKAQKRAQEGIRMLEASGFFRNETVLAVLGKETDYAQWLSTQECCHPGDQPCPNQPVVAWSVPGARRWVGIPLCVDHVEIWDAGTTQLPDGSSPLAFAQTQNIYYRQRWARSALNKQLRVPQEHLPTPGAIFTWATDQKLNHLIPSAFKSLIT